MMVICSEELVFLREVDRFRAYLEETLILVSQWMNFGVIDME